MGTKVDEISFVFVVAGVGIGEGVFVCEVAAQVVERSVHLVAQYYRIDRKV